MLAVRQVFEIIATVTIVVVILGFIAHLLLPVLISVSTRTYGIHCVGSKPIRA